MAERALRGDTVYSIKRWLDTAGAPLPPRRDPSMSWAWQTVDGLLKNPVLAGRQASNPGTSSGRTRGPGLLRDRHGALVVDKQLAIISVAEHKRLVHLLSNKQHPAAKCGILRSTTSPLLDGLMTCGLQRADDAHGRRPRQSATAALPGLPGLRIPPPDRGLPQHRLLTERGKLPTYRRTLAVPKDERSKRRLAVVDDALRQAAVSLTTDGADVGALTRQIGELKLRRRQILSNAESTPDVETGPHRPNTRAGLSSMRERRATPRST